MTSGQGTVGRWKFKKIVRGKEILCFSAHYIAKLPKDGLKGE
jgi:hypothetical protein